MYVHTPKEQHINLDSLDENEPYPNFWIKKETMDKLGHDQMASNLHRRHDAMVQYNVC